MNETIEKIAKVLCSSYADHSYSQCGYCSGEKDKYLNCKDLAQAIYTEIVEPLEKENERLQWYFENKDRDIDAYRRKVKELQHKAKVLERALRYLAHDFNGQQFYIYAQSDTDEETYEKFIQRAEKEISNETL